jgi:hypothetical protein
MLKMKLELVDIEKQRIMSTHKPDRYQVQEPDLPISEKKYETMIKSM